MADATFDRLLADLGSRFDALVEREERAAAADLAQSFVQDRTFGDAVAALGRADVTTWGGGRSPVVGVGPDYVEAAAHGRLFVRSAFALVTGAGDRAAARIQRNVTPFLEVMRGAARMRRSVQVYLDEGRSISGVLASAGRDHLVIERQHGSTVIGLAVVRAVRLPGEDSGDAF